MKRPDCGRAMELVDKTTFTGRGVRQSRCTPCDQNVIERGGIAPWQARSDARAAAERAVEEKCDGRGGAEPDRAC